MLWKELSGWEVFVCQLALILLAWWWQLPTEIRAACTSTATGLEMTHIADSGNCYAVLTVHILYIALSKTGAYSEL
jgi:hypothetical protein